MIQVPMTGMDRHGSAKRRRLAAAVLVLPLLFASCGSPAKTPGVKFSHVPLADPGGPVKIDLIEGSVTRAEAGQKIVLFARSGAMWYVQPFADRPFTSIGPDLKWRNSTHLGTEYAVLLVGAGYVPPASMSALPSPGGEIIAIAVEKGEPHFWQRWWFRSAIVLVAVAGVLLFYRWRMRELARQLNLRFEERLAERTRIAQELHDTLLQGVLSTSMQLHVAVEQLPENSPVAPQFRHIQELMERVVEEGRNALRGLRSAPRLSEDLEQAFLKIPQEIGIEEEIAFRVIVEGTRRPLHPVIRDQVYRIGREALINAFRHAQAKTIEVEIEYAVKHLRILVRDDGRGMAPDVVQSGREGHWGLSGMQERAQAIGARLKVWTRDEAGTEIELSIPGHVAFEHTFDKTTTGSAKGSGLLLK